MDAIFMEPTEPQIVPMTGEDGTVYEVKQSVVPVVTEDGYYEILISTFPRGFFGPEEPEEEYDPEPPGLELWHPEVPFSEN